MLSPFDSTARTCLTGPLSAELRNQGLARMVSLDVTGPVHRMIAVGTNASSGVVSLSIFASARRGGGSGSVTVMFGPDERVRWSRLGGGIGVLPDRSTLKPSDAATAMRLAKAVRDRCAHV